MVRWFCLVFMLYIFVHAYPYFFSSAPFQFSVLTLSVQLTTTLFLLATSIVLLPFFSSCPLPSSPYPFHQIPFPIFLHPLPFDFLSFPLSRSPSFPIVGISSNLLSDEEAASVFCTSVRVKARQRDRKTEHLF